MKKRWIVKRIIEELFDVEADSKAEALEIINERGNPHSVIIKKETVKQITPPHETDPRND